MFLNEVVLKCLALIPAKIEYENEYFEDEVSVATKDL